MTPRPPRPAAPASPGHRGSGRGTRDAAAVPRAVTLGLRDEHRQLAFAARIRELFGQGHTLAAALRILALEDDLAAERALRSLARRPRAG